MTDPVVVVVAAPLAGAALSLWTRGAVRAWCGVLAGLATAAAAIGLAASVWGQREPAGIRLAGPAGIDVILLADGLGSVALLMASVVGLGVCGFAAAEDRRRGDRDRAWWPLSFVLWAGLQLLFLAGDLLTAYFLFELVGVVAASLVVLGGDRRARLAGTRYLYAELVATATVLAGIGLVWHDAGTLELAELASGPGGLTARAGLALVTVGLLLKVPLVPLHFWLPAAHAHAPSAVSPVLSAVVVKSAFVVLLRLWWDALPDLVPPGGPVLLGILGAGAVVWGSLNALRAVELKVMLANSTVAQLGFLFLLVPMLTAGSASAWRGGVTYAVAHAPAKAAMLMAAALLIETVGRSDVAGLTGAAVRRPIAVFAFGVGAVSLVGLPPTGGFVAKWYLVLAGLETGQWWWTLVVVVGSLLTAGYVMRVLRGAFAPATAGDGLGTFDVRDVVALVLALVTLVFGLRPTEFLDLLQVGWPLAGPGA